MKCQSTRTPRCDRFPKRFLKVQCRYCFVVVRTIAVCYTCGENARNHWTTCVKCRGR